MDAADHKPSGWYPDESNFSVERWWNGISWGDQTRPLGGARPIVSVPMSTPIPVDPYATRVPTPPRQPAPAQAAPGQAPFGQAAPGQGRPIRGQFRRLNQIGYSGVGLGVISLLFNFYAIPSVLAIIFTSIGLYRIRKFDANTRRAAGLVGCIIGLVLGLVETAAYVVNTVK